MKRAGMIAFVGLVALVGCDGTNDAASQPTATPSGTPSVTVESQSPSLSSAAPEEGEQGMPTYRVGQAFETNGWRIKVIGFRCAAVEKLTSPSGTSLGDQQDIAGSEDACVVELTYTNVGRAAAEFFGETNANLTGTDAQGRLYEGWTWAQGTVNPGMSDKNQLVFPVATGVKLTTAMIGDAAVNLK
ncbi:hypothetical protein [Micromonospora sp. NPDC049497]|uniref:hypothetical protein n=1 Tax=Micromonospora sp. NPDC049497 TaxID=3364273 RepID=UPI0037ADDD4A